MIKALVRSDGFLVGYSPEVAASCPELTIVEAETTEELLALAQQIAEHGPAQEALRESIIMSDREAAAAAETEVMTIPAVGHDVADIADVIGQGAPARRKGGGRAGR